MYRSSFLTAAAALVAYALWLSPLFCADLPGKAGGRASTAPSPASRQSAWRPLTKPPKLPTPWKPASPASTRAAPQMKAHSAPAVSASASLAEGKAKQTPPTKAAPSAETGGGKTANKETKEPATPPPPPKSPPSPKPRPALVASKKPAAPPVMPPPPRRMVLNFRNASVREVLTQVAKINHLSVVEEADITGEITVISPGEVDVDEAIKILNAALSYKSITVVRSGNVLKIMSLSDAAKSNVPVYTGNDPASVEPGDHVITQIIPLQYADAVQLQQDLAPLIPEHALLVANSGSNTLIYTDTATNVRRLLTILKALDSQIAEVSTIRVFKLKNADATELAEALRDLFAEDSRSRGSSSGRSSFLDAIRRRMMMYRFGRGR